jgi:hypothetical protein
MVNASSHGSRHVWVNFENKTIETNDQCLRLCEQELDSIFSR